MKTRRLLPVIILVLIVLGLAACNKGGKKEPSHLDQALAMAPSNTQWFFFTDWALIKEYEGFQDISSQDSMERKMQFLLFGSRMDPPQPMRQYPASAYGLQYIRNHAEVWGWDSTDLVWEATIELEEGAPLYVLQFPPDFDLTPFVDLLQEREFTTSTYRDVTIYSHEMDLKAEWLRQAAVFGILNTAVLDKEKRLVLSPNLDSVESVLDAYKGDAGSLADDSAARATADRLGTVAATAIGASPDVCLGFRAAVFLEMSGTRITPEQLEKLKARFDRETVRAYLSLGVGYRYEDDAPVGLIVMHYASADDAQADLDTRQKLVDEGVSLITRKSFRESLFTIDEASVQGTDLVWRVSPTNQMPRRLFEMIFQRDMLFAACP